MLALSVSLILGGLSQGAKAPKSDESVVAATERSSP
jgi:hypothetical protein